ncbi:MAG: glycosyltransferase family 4 protein [Fimbriimonadaceae bacterium]
MSDRPLKVLQIVSSSAAGGAERHVLDLSESLKERGHYVELICPGEGWVSSAAREAGLPVHLSPMKRMGWLATRNLIANRVASGGIELIHTHLTRASYIGYAAGLKTRVPVITTVHLLNNDRLYRQIARGRNRLVAVSEYVASVLHDRGVAKAYIDTVYNGTDFLQFKPAEPAAVKAELGIPQDRLVIGIVGRICRTKGHIEMVQALKSIRKQSPKAHAVFVGRLEKDFKEELTRAVASEGLADHITFTGVREDVPRLMDSFDISAMPSHMETFGLAAIEAMARSRPVIATNVGALPEVVSHGKTGLLVPVDAEQLAGAALKLLHDAPLRRAMGKCARKDVEQRFSLATMAFGCETVYRKALAPTSA